MDLKEEKNDLSTSYQLFGWCLKATVVVLIK